MTRSPADTPIYTDLNGLTSLKRGAAAKDPAAIRKVAEQFESMFTRMMLKSMRDTVGKDSLFGSDQQKMYQDMADDQLSVQLSKGKGLGLADMLLGQMKKTGVPGAAEALASRHPQPLASPGRLGAPAHRLTGNAVSATHGAATYAATQQTTPGSVTSVKADFINRMWPHAQEAAQQLGTDPRHLIAQAALETNWGRSLPHDGSGRSSHNLFGIKAGGDWNGAAVAARTREFRHGAAGATTAAFRAYSGPEQSFRDYVALLRGNSRYAGALNTGNDTHAFASALQHAGYATDPDYVHKIKAIVHGIQAPQSTATLMAANGEPQGLKFASALPITPTTGAL